MGMKKEEVITSARVMIGAYLKELREDQKVTLGELRQKGMRYEVARSIEEGSASYTIDSLLQYCQILKIQPVFFHDSENDGHPDRLSPMLEKIRKL
jgi:transcriptional regulator with XRE-family HTH domain